MGGEVGPEDNEALMVELLETGVWKNGFLDIAEGLMHCGCPVGCNSVSIFKFSGEFAKSSYPKFEMRDEFAVELRKLNAFSNVEDSLRVWPMLKKLML
jgi:hypothetical protein